MADMIFKYSELEKFLEHARVYAPVIPFREWEGQKAIILRHDIDLDIVPAYEMARIERKCGVYSTFMVMITCPIYNPSAKKNRDMLRQMSEWGFEMGLHFDPNIYSSPEGDNLGVCLKREAAILSGICGKNVESVSLHNPSGFGQFPLFAGYKNAYDPNIFNDDCYMSDSRMLFSGKDPFEFVKLARMRPIQVVLHPEHYSPDGIEYPEIFANITARYINDLDRWYRVNSTYVEQMPDHLHGYLIQGGLMQCSADSIGYDKIKKEQIPRQW